MSNHFKYFLFIAIAADGLEVIYNPTVRADQAIRYCDRIIDLVII